MPRSLIVKPNSEAKIYAAWKRKPRWPTEPAEKPLTPSFNAVAYLNYTSIGIC